jgi:hypothetical protein
MTILWLGISARVNVVDKRKIAKGVAKTRTAQAGGCVLADCQIGDQAMKTTILAAVLMIGVAACTQKSETTTSADNTATTSTSTTTVSTTVPTVDTAATAEAKRDVKDASKDVAAGAQDAAHATGTAMETAGKEIQKRSKPDRH